ncbi:LuxR C-terminal-related transcriptional regulator [Allorhizocola rhizosphaerae]|uniref:LuxR C-terminal-related transcriptional regulator n=1 Tax=Allorhizocola rhizosphaerae TaxID=1872709 RepID=UPI0013C30E77|nr:LuxR C-terminal-related transcriptional regulator [Allorhizocola rhizosphaerae]
MRIAIRCERRLFRDALATSLAAHPDFAVVGHVSRPDDLFELCALRRPDVVLFDTAAQVSDGLEALRALRSQFPETAVVLAYDRLDPEEVTSAILSGVDTLVPCSHGLDALMTVLRQCGSQACVRAGLTSKRRIHHHMHGAQHGTEVAHGVLLVLLRGAHQAACDYVMPALLAHGIPFVIDNTFGDSEIKMWDQLHAGPVLLVLVDPTRESWLGLASLTVPIALARTGPVLRAEVMHALDRGVRAVVSPAQMQCDELVSVLTLAAHGHVVLAVPDAGSVIGGRPRGMPQLTAREGDILRSIACGHTVRQTAHSLGIAEKTVENTQARLFRKLGAHNRVTALVAAETLGLIELLAGES